MKNIFKKIRLRILILRENILFETAYRVTSADQWLIAWDVHNEKIQNLNKQLKEL